MHFLVFLLEYMGFLRNFGLRQLRFPPKLRLQNPANTKLKQVLFAYSDFL